MTDDRELEKKIEDEILSEQYQLAAMRSLLLDIKDGLGDTLTASLLYSRIANVLKDQTGKEMLERELELREKSRPGA